MPAVDRSSPPRAHRISRMAIRPHPEGWALKVDDIAEPAWVLQSRERAVSVAREAAAFHGCPLHVHDRADQRQRTLICDTTPHV